MLSVLFSCSSPVTESTGAISGTAQLNGAATGNAGIFVYLAGSSNITITSDAGAFSLGGVAPGSYTLVASKEGYSSIRVDPVNVTTGSLTDVGTLSLTRGPEGIVSTLVATVGFTSPMGIATDGINLFVADSMSHTIRKILISSGLATILAGTAGAHGSTDGTGSAAQFYVPSRIATDGTNLYVSDTFNHTIRQIVISSGVVTTLAGTAGAYGNVDSTGSAARFHYPEGIATDGVNLYVADSFNNAIRKIIISTGVVTTLAGTAGSPGSADGAGSAARFYQPIDITTDGADLYVMDNGNGKIRRIR